jgi:hypothetical protein
MVVTKRWFAVAVLVPAALVLGPSAGRAQFQGAGMRGVLPGRQAPAQPPANVSPPIIGSPQPAQTILPQVRPSNNFNQAPTATATQQQQLLSLQQLAATTQPLTPFQQQQLALWPYTANGLLQQNLWQQQQLGLLQQQGLLMQPNLLTQPNLLAQPNPLQQPNPLMQPNPLLQPNFFQQPNLFQQPNPFQQINPFQVP